MPPLSLPEPDPRRWRWRVLAAVLILAAAGLRLAYLAGGAAPDLAPDEAHYWDWSRHPDWSYYSKGPLVAWLIGASRAAFGEWSVTQTGTEVLAVRLPAVACGALLLVSLYVLAAQVFRSERLGFLVVAFALTLPAVHAGGLLMTIDAPFVCCWGWALVFGHAALVRGRAWAWPAAGLMVALGTLAKYTMVLWPESAFLFLLFSPGRRVLLRRPGFWVLVLVGCLGWLPILWWNARNGWVTFAHVGTQAGLAGSGGTPRLRWLGPPEYLGGQFALLLGFWFVLGARAVWAWRPAGDVPDGVRYLWWMAVPTFALFALFSPLTKIQLNWPVTAYLAGGVLTCGWLAGKMGRLEERRRRAWHFRLAAVSAAGLGLSWLLLDIRPARPVLARVAGPATAERPTPVRKLDPTCRLRGWRHLAAEIDRCRAALAREGTEPVLAAGTWTVPGELGFYCAGHPQVYSFGSALGERHSQYDLWRPNPLSDPGAFAGRTFVYVGGPEVAFLLPAFERIEPARRVEYREDGRLISHWTYWVCRGFRGLPALPAPAGGPRY